MAAEQYFAFGACCVVAPTSDAGSAFACRSAAQGHASTRKCQFVKVKERLEQALEPLSKAIPLSPSDVTRTRAWLIQAGLRESRHINYYFGSRLALATLGFAGVVAFSGF